METFQDPEVTESMEYGSSYQYNHNADTNTLSTPPEPLPQKQWPLRPAIQRETSTGYTRNLEVLETFQDPEVTESMEYGSSNQYNHNADTNRNDGRRDQQYSAKHQ